MSEIKNRWLKLPYCTAYLKAQSAKNDYLSFLLALWERLVFFLLNLRLEVFDVCELHFDHWKKKGTKKQWKTSHIIINRTGEFSLTV